MRLKRRLAQIILLLAGVVVFGTAGYVVIERFTAFDALYLTMITIGSVGFGEIPRPLSPGGRAFTMVLIVVGLGSMAYGLSAMTAFFVEGQIAHAWERRKMDARIAKLRSHVVVCGGGQTGRHIADELIKTRTPFVLIEQSMAELEAIKKLSEDVLYILGDATDSDVLREAGVEHALGLITCMPSDKDNVFTLLSGRELNPAVRTVSRLVSDEARPALQRAGADAIVSLPTIGALRIASVMLRPIVVTVLDTMLRGPSAIRVEEIVVGKSVAGRSLADLRIQERLGLVVFAIHERESGRHRFNPPPDTVVRAGDALIACADPDQLREARKLVTEG